MRNESDQTGRESSNYESRETLLGKSPLLSTYISPEHDQSTWMDAIRVASVPYQAKFDSKLQGSWEVMLIPLINQGLDTKIFAHEFLINNSLKEQAESVTLANIVIGYELQNKKNTFTFIDEISERYSKLPFIDWVHESGTIPIRTHLKLCMETGADIYDRYERTTQIPVRFNNESDNLKIFREHVETLDLDWMR